jgi:hypothetical protein
LIALPAFQSSASGDEPAKSGIVHFNVVDAYGNSLLPSEIKVTNKQDARQTTVSNIAIQTLPYGEYEVRVLVPGFAYWFRTINVDKPDSNIPVGMLAGAMEGRPPTCSVSGTIKGLRREVFGTARIRLVPVFLDRIIEGRIAPTGHFQMPAADCGSYVLTLSIERDVVWSSQVKLSLETKPFAITVGKW